MSESFNLPNALIIGAGPAGLMAAEVLSTVARVTVCDAMPTAGRKFLMAGVGGMNITHSEPLNDFVNRYHEASSWLSPLLQTFGPAQLRDWMHGLGIETFIGSSGRVFPKDMKAAPLLRLWLARLRANGVHFLMRHRWIKSEGQQHYFSTAQGDVCLRADVVVFALGGGSWKKLGSDGAWVSCFSSLNVDVNPLQPSNCGFELQWSDYVRAKFSGAPIKPVTVSVMDCAGNEHRKQGEFVLTDYGIEGTAIYALSAVIRQRLVRDKFADVYLDLAPQIDHAQIHAILDKPRGKKTLASFLQNSLSIKGAKLALLHEVLTEQQLKSAPELAKAIKSLPIRLHATRPLDEAISTAGGVALHELSDELMLKKYPGLFCAGEMLDWEAPTGGYLLTACFATGYQAGIGARDYLASLKC